VPRKVLITMYMTLDGFAALADGPDDPEAEREFWEVMRTGPMHEVDTLLLGRKTYEAWAGFWPGLVDSENEHWRAFARFSTKAEKVVFSQTLQTATWSNSRIVRGSVADEISRLRSLAGKNIIVAGGVQLVQSVLAQDLADELCLTVSPSIIGRGLPLFHMEPTLDHHDDVVPLGAPGRHDFRLLESRAFRSGAVYLRYATSRKDQAVD
jgi:dihydrofolate reductase